jgi:hypothetical protein
MPKETKNTTENKESAMPTERGFSIEPMPQTVIDYLRNNRMCAINSFERNAIIQSMSKAYLPVETDKNKVYNTIKLMERRILTPGAWNNYVMFLAQTPCKFDSDINLLEFYNTERDVRYKNRPKGN